MMWDLSSQPTLYGIERGVAGEPGGRMMWNYFLTRHFTALSEALAVHMTHVTLSWNRYLSLRIVPS